MTNKRQLIAATTNNVEAALTTSANLGGTVYVDHREAWQHLPFRALLTVTTDNLTDLESCSEVGLYVICERTIKPGHAKVFGLFPMVHAPGKTPAECDAHWRDNHGPLALEHHPFMSHYLQLAVVHRLAGPDINGFALCGFDSEEDLRERFYVSDEGVKIIAEDIRKFANLKESPRRLIAVPT